MLTPVDHGVDQRNEVNAKEAGGWTRKTEWTNGLVRDRECVEGVVSAQDVSVYGARDLHVCRAYGHSSRTFLVRDSLGW